jgi:hypothetical protein
MANEMTAGNEHLGLGAIPLFRKLSPAAVDTCPPRYHQKPIVSRKYVVE